ncbi:MAG: enoyl-CoA hydratase/isomerase family protein [Rhodospirillales bacterium]|nr:enoyl-CoA hydratase/isomerase family protein [Alphaproteobacteria bacterium]MBL6948540.1 enoyl-CoA hydratase/isomerase family protein [Rhodospirillales bacterium]
MTDIVLVDRDGDIATVILNRPDKLNAFTKGMWGRLGAVMDELSADTALRCIILRGAGDKAFSPGNDISEFADERSNSTQAEAYGEFMNATIAAIRACPVPKVAMIKGVCVGGGLEVAGLCDIRIGGESSRFGAPISKLGLVMGYKELGALSDLVGAQAAYEILLEGRILGATEALQKGILSRIVPDDEVEAEALATARRIADGAPLVHRWHRKFLDRMADPTPLSEEEIKEAYACYDTEDFKTGYSAFLEKKKPDFKGR